MKLAHLILFLFSVFAPGCSLTTPKGYTVTVSADVLSQAVDLAVSKRFGGKTVKNVQP